MSEGKIGVYLEVGPDDLMRLIQLGFLGKSGPLKARLVTPKAAEQSDVEPNVSQYLRPRGTGNGTKKQGKPSVLNEAGMKKVWDLHQEGHSPRVISRILSGIIGPSGVSKLIKKIKAAGEKR